MNDEEEGENKGEKMKTKAHKSLDKSNPKTQKAMAQNKKNTNPGINNENFRDRIYKTFIYILK